LLTAALERLRHSHEATKSWSPTASIKRTDG
jgi:hypothetical protein